MAYKYLGKTAKLYPARNIEKKYSIFFIRMASDLAKTNLPDFSKIEPGEALVEGL